MTKEEYLNSFREGLQKERPILDKRAELAGIKTEALIEGLVAAHSIGWYLKADNGTLDANIYIMCIDVAVNLLLNRMKDAGASVNSVEKFVETFINKLLSSFVAAYPQDSAGEPLTSNVPEKKTVH